MDPNILNVVERQILSIFDNEEDIEKLRQIIDIDIGKVPIGMSQFQIENFVLNKREFTNELFQFQQTKTELFTRLQGFIDSYYQLRESQAKIKLAEGKIEDLRNNGININSSNSKIKDAKIELQQIEIDKNRFRISSLDIQNKQKLKEALIFYNIYEKYRYLEDLSKEELNKMEEEGWRIKSAYYQELVDRYGLTPRGFMIYPHEIDGLKGLLDSMENNGRLPLQIRNKESDM